MPVEAYLISMLGMMSAHSRKHCMTTLCSRCHTVHYHLTKLLMGWTNAVPVFHNDVMHILQLEVPRLTIPYIDDVPVHRPATTYQNGNGVFETILENSSIHHFIWEHFQNLNCIVQ